MRKPADHLRSHKIPQPPPLGTTGLPLLPGLDVAFTQRIESFRERGARLVTDLVGIAPDETSPGFRHVVIKPSVVGSLSWVKGRYETVRGPITAAWRRENSCPST